MQDNGTPKQPPPRGCVLKREQKVYFVDRGGLQPPPRGCVLKHNGVSQTKENIWQPPPRGCVLKQAWGVENGVKFNAAASARLCVETCYLTN